jgi:hypothetical protein
MADRLSPNPSAGIRRPDQKDLPSNASVAANAYLAAAKAYSAGATAGTVRAVQGIQGDPPVTEGYQMQQFFLYVRGRGE